MAVSNKHKVLSPSNLNIIGLTEDLTPDTATDYLATYDASAGQNKRVLLDNLGLGGGGNTFTIIQPDAGTAPTADSASDTLTLTSSNASITITGDSTTDTIDLTTNITLPNCFKNITTDLGSTPVADSPFDNLTLTSSDSSIAVTGTSSTDTVDFITRYSNPDGTYTLTESFGDSTTINGDGSCVFGKNSVVGANATAFGYSSNANGLYATAFGRQSQASATWSMSLGPYNVVTHTESCVIGGNIASRATNECIIGTGSTKFNSFVFGQGPTLAVPQDVTMLVTGGSGTDIAGADWTIQGGAGTGTGAGGELIFQTAPAGSTGSTLNTQTTKLTIKEAGILSAVPFSPGQYATGSLPTASSFEGYLTYDTTTNEIKFSDGSTWDTLGGAGGDVTGPSSSTDNSVPRFDSTTGKLLQGYTSNPLLVTDAGQLQLGNDGSGTTDLSMCWSGKTNSGFYRDVNQIYFVTNGTIVLDFSPNRTRAYEPFQSSNGAVGEPIYSFATMNDGGLWRDSATDSLKMSVNGVANFVWEDGYNESLMPLRLASYATGSLPTASSHEGSIVYDSTTQTIKWSDGTSWATI